MSTDNTHDHDIHLLKGEDTLRIWSATPAEATTIENLFDDMVELTEADKMEQRGFVTRARRMRRKVFKRGYIGAGGDLADVKAMEDEIKSLRECVEMRNHVIADAEERITGLVREREVMARNNRELVGTAAYHGAEADKLRKQAEAQGMQLAQAADECVKLRKELENTRKGYHEALKSRDNFFEQAFNSGKEVERLRKDNEVLRSVNGINLHAGSVTDKMIADLKSEIERLRESLFQRGILYGELKRKLAQAQRTTSEARSIAEQFRPMLTQIRFPWEQ